MTLTAPAPAPVAEPGKAPRSGRPWRTWLLVAAAFVVAVGLAVLAAPKQESGQAYDPADTGPDGTRALVRVLRDHGIEVDVARSAAALDRIDTGSDTTIMVTGTSMLGKPTAARLAAHATDGGARIVLAAPDAYVARLMQAPAAVGGTSSSVPAGCSEPTWKGLTIRADTAITYDAGGCFSYYDGNAKGVVLADHGSVSWTLGAPDILTNDQITRADNAAVALRLLGARPHLVWYVPSYADLSAGQGHSVRDLIPHWIMPSLWLAMIAVVALALARGRRLGPLAVEPLPVSVRADETTRSLGRLYRRSGDRAHAAGVLRGATRARLATRLQLGRGAGTEALVSSVVARTGRQPAEVTALLTDGPPPANDHDLITLAHDLAALEKELHP